MTPSIIYEFDPWKLPGVYLAAIGLVATSSAQTESIVETAIAACLDIDFEQGMAVTTHMNAPQRDNVLRAAAEIKIDDAETLDQLDKLLDDIKTAFAKRNDYVHRTWCQDPQGKVYTVDASARGSVTMDLVAVPIEQLRSDAQFIYEAGMQLQQFLSLRKLYPKDPPPDRNRFHRSKAERKKRRKAKTEV